MQSHLRARGRGGSAQGREGVGTPRGQGGWSVLRERGAGERVAGGGPHSLFLRWSVILHSCSFLAAQGGGRSMQLRAGQGGRGKEKQQAAQKQRGQGGRGAGVAPGVRHNPVFGSPGEEFPPLHPCPGQGGGEGEDPGPRELAPAKAWKEGSAWGLLLPFGVWLEPQPTPWPWSARQLAK